jgi:hypothetical protein
MEGTFIATKAGFFTSAAPVHDPGRPIPWSALGPWEVLFAVMERAKRGDFSHSRQIFHILDEAAHMDLLNGAIVLAGFTAPADELARWVAGLQTTEMSQGILKDAAQALEYACGLWAVPALLQLHRGSSYEPTREIVQWRTARIIEPRGGPLHDVEVSDGFREIAAARHRELVERFGSEKTIVRYGRVFDVTDLAHQMLVNLRDPEQDEFDFGVDRRVFEAYTGVDCRPCFAEGELQRLTAAALLEEFLDDPPRLERGVRYFFKHRVPDTLKTPREPGAPAPVLD